MVMGSTHIACHDDDIAARHRRAPEHALTHGPFTAESGFTEAESEAFVKELKEQGLVNFLRSYLTPRADGSIQSLRKLLLGLNVVPVSLMLARSAARSPNPKGGGGTRARVCPSLPYFAVPPVVASHMLIETASQPTGTGHSGYCAPELCKSRAISRSQAATEAP